VEEVEKLSAILFRLQKRKHAVIEMNNKENIPSDRAFGIFVLAICIFSSSYSFLRARLFIGVSLLIATFLMLIIVIVAPRLLNHFNSLWFRFGIVLNKIMGFFVLGIIFFIVITPIAILMRISGRDELMMRQGKKKSYWKNAAKPTRPKDYFTRQF
jgi:hypothetical protein